MLTASGVLQKLKALGVTHVVGLPDNTSAALFEKLKGDPDVQLISVTREGEAFALATGLWMGGKTPVVLIQNTGLIESGDGLRGTAMRMRIPLLCLITYRGFAKMRKAGLDPRNLTLDGDLLGRGDVDSVALVTEPTLSAWGVPFSFLNPDDSADLIDAAFEKCLRSSQPVALLITGDLT